MKTKRIVQFVIAITMMIGALKISAQEAQASVWDSAYTYYNSYGNSVVFRPVTSTDGIIYYATKASKATTSTKFRTLGWKVTVRNTSGSTLQTLYFKLSGSYMYQVDSVTKGNYEYNLYALSLYQMKSRMNTRSGNALQAGKAAIQLDACMAVVKNGSVKGRMNDSGPVSGSVYTTYSGIAGAANWSSSARQSLYSYFNKNVEGLFFRVNVIAGEGIKSTSGSGVYCYGTYAEVNAVTDTGYQFANWSGLLRSSKICDDFLVNEDGVCIANGEPKLLRIYYHRNQSSQDNTVDYQVVRYNKSGANLEGFIWKKDGKAALGWAFDPSATREKYKLNAKISAKWIDQYAPEVHLYAVWDSTDPNPGPQPPTPQPPIPQPPTPQPPTPQPPTQEPQESGYIDEKTTTNKVIRCRFISSRYFEDEYQRLIPQDRGGLAADSVWATDMTHRQILRYALGKN